MKRLQVLLVIVFLVAGMWDCTKTPTEVTTPVPTVLTDSATSVSSTGAMLNATVNAGGSPTTCFFKYGTTQAYGIQTPAQNIGTDNAQVAANYQASGLAPSTLYHYRVTATNANGVGLGADMEFTTLALTPVVTADSVIRLSQTSVILKGKINPMGFSTIFHFEYGFNTSYGMSTPVQDAGFGVGAVSESTTVGNLTPGSTYHWRLVASNSGGTTYGHDAAFTAGFPRPAITANAARVLDSSDAVLSGYVNPNGAATTYHFEYGASAGYGQTTPPQSIGSGILPTYVSASMAGLMQNSVYHWRLVAVNGGGTASTSDSTFTTPVDFTTHREFIFPLSVGTTWEYDYLYHYWYSPMGVSDVIHGLQTWRVTSVTGTVPPFSAQISVARVDTTHHTMKNSAINVDTTYVTTAQTTFSVDVTPDSIKVWWTQVVSRTWLKVGLLPRFVDLPTDTLEIYLGGDLHASYVSRIGLIDSYALTTGMNNWEEQLTLLSYSIPPSTTKPKMRTSSSSIAGPPTLQYSRPGHPGRGEDSGRSGRGQ